MKRIKLILIIIVMLIAAVILTVLIGILCSRRLTVAEYTQPLKDADGDVKIVFLSDLHGSEFGKDNCKLLEQIEAQNPDLIALVGDFMNRDSDDEEIEEMLTFMEQLPAIAPTYFSIGNHEGDYIANHGEELLDRICALGITVLECEYEDLTIHGTTFRFGGMSELAYYGGDFKFDSKAESFLTDYCDTELPKVMLSHRPEAFAFRYACQSWDVDLILSGHTHGGLVRLPIIGGLVAPIQGWFPAFCYGEYQIYDSKIIISSGLAGYEGYPRVFNPPEICVVTLTAKE